MLLQHIIEPKPHPQLERGTPLFADHVGSETEDRSGIAGTNIIGVDGLVSNVVAGDNLRRQPPCEIGPDQSVGAKLPGPTKRCSCENRDLCIDDLK